MAPPDVLPLSSERPCLPPLMEHEKAGWADQVPSLIPLPSMKPKKEAPPVTAVISTWQVHQFVEPKKETRQRDPLVPLVPDDFVPELLPADTVLLERAFGKKSLLLSLALCGLWGTIVGASAAVLVS